MRAAPGVEAEGARRDSYHAARTNLAGAADMVVVSE